MSSRISPLRDVFICLLFLILTLVTRSEIRTFEGPLDASSDSIHFSEGYLDAPGFIDLSGLQFTNNDDGRSNYNNLQDAKVDENQVVDDDEDYHNGGGRRLMQREMQYGIQMIDLVLFREPEECRRKKGECDWSKLGIGASDDEGDLSWCCSKDSISLGLCGVAQLNRIIIKPEFEGHTRSILVPRTGFVQLSVQDGLIEEKISGKHILVISNCNDDGRNMLVSGKYVWMSKGGYLPGDLFGDMYFLLFLTLSYGGLLAWYFVSMKLYEDSTIPIQYWIMGTIVLGELEVFFKAGDFWVWNEDGTRFIIAMYTGVLLGVFKRALSRCLMVMISLGWGVVKDRLTNIKKIIFLGVVYAIASAAWDFIKIFAIVENKVMGPTENVEVISLITILSLIVSAIDACFYFWILDALSGTMKYLKNKSQDSKLQRYKSLRLLFIVSILVALAASVYIVRNRSETDQSNEWMATAAVEANYLMVMIGVAYLWKPNSMAKEYAGYAQVVELTSMDDANELSDDDVETLDTNYNVLQRGDDGE